MLGKADVIRGPENGGDGIVCERVYFDSATILAQLGLISLPVKPPRSPYSSS